jgi:hypothetical protein
MNNKYSGFSSRYFKFMAGITLTAATVGLVVLISSPRLQGSDSARYIASFITGMFGFAAIETIRRSLD